MKDKLQQLSDQFSHDISGTGSLKDLEDLDTKYLGRKAGE